jgi:hypothetical protein
VAKGNIERYAKNPFDAWTDIVSVAGGYSNIHALHSDGSVSTGGRTWDLSGATAVGISGTDYETIILKADGTVDYGVTYAPENYQSPYDVLDAWTDIVAVDASSAGNGHGYVLGLKSDGTVVMAKAPECNLDDVSSLTNIRIPKR